MSYLRAISAFILIFPTVLVDGDCQNPNPSCKRGCPGAGGKLHFPSTSDLLSGEYTSQSDPDMPEELLHGEWQVHRGLWARSVPEELTPVSAVEFSISGTRETIRFTVDAEGHGTSLAPTAGRPESHRNRRLPCSWPLAGERPLPDSSRCSSLQPASRRLESASCQCRW